jgi:hypothetical protein
LQSTALTIDNTFSALLWPQSCVCVRVFGALFVQGRIPLRPESSQVEGEDASFRQVYIFRVCLGQVYLCLAASAGWLADCAAVAWQHLQAKITIMVVHGRNIFHRIIITHAASERTKLGPQGEM